MARNTLIVLLLTLPLSRCCVGWIRCTETIQTWQWLLRNWNNTTIHACFGTENRILPGDAWARC